jgi:hypothetical protein
MYVDLLQALGLRDEQFESLRSLMTWTQLIP